MYNANLVSLASQLEFCDRVCQRRNENRVAGWGQDIMYLDFQKAFDKILHKTLLRKFVTQGWQGKVQTWIKKEIRSWKERVGINSQFSAWKEVNSGVLLGSSQGTRMLNMFINDLEDGSELQTSPILLTGRFVPLSWVRPRRSNFYLLQEKKNYWPEPVSFSQVWNCYKCISSFFISGKYRLTSQQKALERLYQSWPLKESNLKAPGIRPEKKVFNLTQDAYKIQNADSKIP